MKKRYNLYDYWYNDQGQIEERPLCQLPYKELLEVLSLHWSQCPGYHLAFRQAALKELVNHHSRPILEENPVEKGSELVMVGDSAFKYKELKARLEPLGIRLATKVTPHTTHILLGMNPKKTKGLEHFHKTLMQDTDLQQVLDKLEQPYLKAEDDQTADNVEQIANLLMSAVDENIMVAVQLMEGGGFPEALLPHAFIAMKQTNSREVYLGIKKILNKYLGVSAKKAIQRTLEFHKGLQEFKLQRNLKKYTSKTDDLDGEAIAKLMFDYHKKCHQYLYAFSEDSTFIEKTIRHFMVDDTLDMSGQGLTRLPKELANFDNIKKINLSYNNFSSIPPILAELPSVEYLDISRTSIRGINTVLQKMKNLKHVNLQWTVAFWETPNLKNLTQLEKLELSDYYSYNEDFMEMAKKALAQSLPDCEITYH